MAPSNGIGDIIAQSCCKHLIQTKIEQMELLL